MRTRTLWPVLLFVILLGLAALACSPVGQPFLVMEQSAPVTEETPSPPATEPVEPTATPVAEPSPTREPATPTAEKTATPTTAKATPTSAATKAAAKAAATPTPAWPAEIVVSEADVEQLAASAAAHSVPYVATACPSYPIDLIQKVKKAAQIEGPAYIHILSVCPTGWRSAPELSIRLGRLAAETGIFPLYEVEHGTYRLNIDFPQLKPVKEYIKLQGRFRHLTEEMIEEIQKRVDQEYGKLRERAKRGF